MTKSAENFLEAALKTIAARGKERDRPDGERSMQHAVALFNEFLNGNLVLSETDGWVFMLCLKLARSQGGKYRDDDWLDLVGYAALAAESAASADAKEHVPTMQSY